MTERVTSRISGMWASPRTRWVAMAFITILLAAPPAQAKGGKHPSLVDPAKAKCATCHGAVLSQKVQHAPAVSDCLSCHEFSKAEGQTLVKLSSAGTDLCLACHDSFEAAAKGKLKAPHAPVTDSCTNCHSPHSSAESNLLKSPAKELCGSCHALEEMNKVHPVSVNRADCGSCHSSHGSAHPRMMKAGRLHPPFSEKSCEACHQKGRAARSRRKSSPAATCYACHSDLEEKFGKGVVHAAVQQGKCTGCHEPHLSDQPKLLRAGGPALCKPCHGQIDAKATGKGGHAPAKQDCSTCHEPHRSESRQKLLKEGLPALCNKCHDPSSQALRKKHLGGDLAKMVCTTCHDPHGGPGKSLVLSVSTHAPFAEGACDTCHQGSATTLSENGSKALCTTCHSDVDEISKKAKVQHPAMESDCVSCHTPHASSQERLLREPAGGECAGCHEAQTAGKGEVAHGVIPMFGCRACHEPHGGNNAKLLRLSANELCLGCHDQKKLKPEAGKDHLMLLGRFKISVNELPELKGLSLSADGTRNHPVVGHRTLGTPSKNEVSSSRNKTSFSGELGCLTCHDPHKGKSRLLLAGGASTAFESCQKCHAK